MSNKINKIYSSVSLKREPILYVKLFRQLLARADPSGFVSSQEAHYVMGFYFRIRNSERFLVYKELQNFGLISVISTRGILLSTKPGVKI